MVATINGVLLERLGSIGDARRYVVDLSNKPRLGVTIESGGDPADKIAIFRVPGAWEADAAKILDKYGVEYCDRTVSISEAARRAVEKIGR